MSTREAVKHTPGPWKLDECFGRDHEHSHYEISGLAPHGVNTGGFNYLIADTAAHDSHISAEEDAANASLIAAAPEMPHECSDHECPGGQLYKRQQQERAEMLEALKDFLRLRQIDYQSECISISFEHAEEFEKRIQALIAKAEGRS